MKAELSRITERLVRLRSLSDAECTNTPPIPRSAKIEIISDCDLSCFFCAHAKRPRARSPMSLTLFVRLARELREAGVEQLGLFYIGEPMLCDWLPQAIEYAKWECGYPHVFVTTNGLKATPKRVRACMLAGLDSLKFALNFSGRTQLRALAGGAAEDLHQLLRNVKDARRIRDELTKYTGRKCGLYASSLLYDERQRDGMRNVLDSLLPYLDEHYWLPVYGHIGLPGARGIPPVQVAVPARRKPLPCWPLFTEAHITFDGKLSACSLDASPRFQMGDLTTTSFSEAWHSAPFQALRGAHLAGEVRGTVCEKCIAY